MPKATTRPLPFTFPTIPAIPSLGTVRVSCAREADLVRTQQDLMQQFQGWPDARVTVTVQGGLIIVRGPRQALDSVFMVPR